MKFDILGKKFGQKVSSTVSEVQKMNEIRQLNNRINDEKKQIQSIYSEIGKKLYRQQQDCPPEGFGVLFEEILECEEAITDYEQQIRDIRKVRICPNCHAEVSLDGKFCSSCGAELPAVKPVVEPEDDFADEAFQEEEAAEDAEVAEKEAVPQDIQETVEAAAEVVQDAAEELTQEAQDIAEDIFDPNKENPEEKAEA